MNQICATKIWRVKHFWEFRHFKRKPDRCPACLIRFLAAAASGAPQRRAAHVFQWEPDRSRTTCESSLNAKKKFGYFTVFDPFQIGASKRSLRYCQVHNYLWRAFIWCKQNRPSIQCLGGCNCCAYKTEMLVLFLVPFLAPVSLYQFEIARCKNSVDLLYVVNKLLATWQLWNDTVTIFWL